MASGEQQAAVTAVDEEPQVKDEQMEDEGPALEDAALEAAADATAAAKQEPSSSGSEVPDVEEPAAEPVDPVHIGYKAFDTGKDCYKYFHGLITKLRKYQNLNEVRRGLLAGSREQRRGCPPDSATAAAVRQTLLLPLSHCRAV